LLKQIKKPERLEQLKRDTPLGELSKPENIADAVVFLCSDQAKMITGISLNVDGGITLLYGSDDDYWDTYVAERKEAAKQMGKQDA